MSAASRAVIAVAASVCVGTLSVPVASAEDSVIHTLGSAAQLVNGDVVQAWTVKDLKPSADVIPYPVAGTLWEATATDAAVRGTVQPVVSNLNARARSGQTYRVLFGVATPQGVNPAVLAEGQQTSGKVYFDVTGDVPDSVVYNAGGPDLAVWVQPPPAPPRASSGSGSSSSSATGGTAPAAAAETAPATATPGATPAAAPSSAGTPVPGSQGTPAGSTGTPAAPGSAGTPVVPGNQGTPVPGSTGTPVPGSAGTPTPSAAASAPSGAEVTLVPTPVGPGAPPALGPAGSSGTPAAGGAPVSPAPVVAPTTTVVAPPA